MGDALYWETSMKTPGSMLIEGHIFSFIIFWILIMPKQTMFNTCKKTLNLVVFFINQFKLHWLQYKYVLANTIKLQIWMVSWKLIIYPSKHNIISSTICTGFNGRCTRSWEYKSRCSERRQNSHVLIINYRFLNKSQIKILLYFLPSMACSEGIGRQMEWVATCICNLMEWCALIGTKKGYIKGAILKAGLGTNRSGDIEI